MSWQRTLLSLVIAALAPVLQGQTKAQAQETPAHDSSWYVVRQYYDTTHRIMDKIMSQEQENLGKASDLMAQSIKEGRLIHVFGTGGHNIMAAMDIFKRAGSLVPINPLFPPGLSVADSHPATERLLGYAEKALVHYDVRQGDVILVINCNGINPVTIEAAVESKKMGLTVIAVTSREFSRGVPKGTVSRHPSNQDLCDLGDIVIDSHVPLGDAIVKVDNFEQEVSSISTMANTFIVQSLVALTVDKLVRMGVEPEVWASANVKGGTENNRKYRAKYRGRIYHLAFY
jgi:uncharacterized phosphosugar-binding protein